MLDEHDRRLRGLDPLLPPAPPLPRPAAGELALAVPSAAGVYRLRRLDADSPEADERAAEVHVLEARVAGPDPAAAMAALLDRWEEHLPAGDGDSEALITWPSRDTSLTSTFLSRGLVPGLIMAARPAGRPSPPVPAGVTVRAMRGADLDVAVGLQLELARWNRQFGGRAPRPATEANARRVLGASLASASSWTWVAEVAGVVTGLIVVTPPERAGWVATSVASGPVAYVGCLVVGGENRGGGVGAALVATAHAALDAAGVGVTLLHYYAMNPLSAPFWHRCGYRPLWTEWSRRPAGPRPGPRRPGPA
ncbi:GNAT family N-acetyltransferase [Saccharothrix sp.]|uniref:GNAT family N-acetyltransferase n=1 Tax=Saccharothrix sp. TaxID=1873460 RepID=UPI0028128A81|nr:GNAT family N-acetyltransferase [Saccharothrix sp.]